MIALIEFFTRRHMVANMITIMIILLGLVTLPSINRDTFPAVDLDEVVVTTRYDGASPEDIELKITNKIEEKIKTIDGIKRFISYSVENISIINIALESNTGDSQKTKDDIRENIAAIVGFPTDLENPPTVTEIESSTFPIVEVSLASDAVSYVALRDIAKQFKNDLEDIAGINNAEGFGYLAKQMTILPSPQRLEAYQLSFTDIIQTIYQQNRRASMGNLITNNTKNTLVNDNRLLTEDDVNNAIVRANFNGNTVRLGDVAVVSLGFEDPTVLSRVSGKQGISFNISKSQSADIITVSNKIADLITVYKDRYPDISFVLANDFSKYLKNRLSVMINNGCIGLVMVMAMLWFFLNLRTAFWVALGIPVAVMGVFFLMPPLDMTINIISLLALIIVIGIIVDDGIIIAENIAKYRERGHDPVDASVQGVHEVFKPVLTTILTTIIAFSPMFFMTGVLGKFIFQIPLVITAALIISLVEVFIALPAHLASQSKYRAVIPKRRHRIVERVRDQYKGLLTPFLQYRYLVVLGFVMMFSFSIFYSVKYMNFVLFPESNAVQFFIRGESEPGTSLEEMNERIQPIEAALLRLPDDELLSFTTRIGMMGDEYFMMEQENLSVTIVDLVPFTRGRRPAREIMKQIKEETENTPGFKSLSYEVSAGGPPVGKSINVRVISENDAQRTAVANQLYDFIASLQGVISVDRNDRAQKKQLVVSIKHNKMAQLGVSVETVHRTIRAAFSGSVPSTLRLGDEDINFKVELSRSDQSSINTLNRLLIANNQGRLIQLKDIATVINAPGSPNYTHYNGRRSISITGDIDKTLTTSKEITRQIKDRFDFSSYATVTLDFGGESEETDSSIQNLLRSFILAIVGIFLLLVVLFNSFTQPLIVILTIPFGLIGVILAFALHGQDLGFISIVGTVGLTGVIVNDSLVLVNHLNNQRRAKMNDQSIMSIVVDGCGDRFRPIIITSCTTIVGLLPLAYGIGGADPFIAPMALAIGYGLLFSTPLILLLLPALYLIQVDCHSLAQSIRQRIARSNDD